MFDIVQIIPDIYFGDAASNQVIAMDKLFKRLGYRTAVVSRKKDPRLDYDVLPFNSFDPKQAKNIVFHFLRGTSFVNEVLKFPQKIILYYHNITPAEHFIGVAWGTFLSSIKGRKQLAQLRERTSFAWSASEYSRQELESVGFEHTGVLPIIVDFSDYKRFDERNAIIKKYKDGKTNLLFVGRVTPHKKQDDLVKIIYYYKNFINPNVRLILVGNSKKAYLKQLDALIRALGIEENVVVTGKVSFDDMCAYYSLADAFVCMSEHEGFLVPLLEAMHYKLPIFAYEGSAIPHTLGKAGVLFEDKEYEVMGETIHAILSDNRLRNEIIAVQDDRLQDFHIDRLTTIVIKNIETYFTR